MSKAIKPVLAVVVIAAIAVGIGVWKSPKVEEIIETVTVSAPEISEQAEAHILHGDKKGGGHLHGTGKPCKSEFPKEWDEADVLENIRKVAANDNLPWKKEKNGYYVASDNVEGVKIRVVLDGDKDNVVTAYPLNGTANRCPSKQPQKAAVRKKAPARPVEEASNDNNAAPVANASARQPRTHNFNAN